MDPNRIPLPGTFGYVSKKRRTAAQASGSSPSVLDPTGGATTCSIDSGPTWSGRGFTEGTRFRLVAAAVSHPAMRASAPRVNQTGKAPRAVRKSRRAVFGSVKRS